MNKKEIATCIEFMNKAVHDMVQELSTQYKGYTFTDEDDEKWTVIGIYLDSQGELCCTIDSTYYGNTECLFSWIN